MFEDTFGRIGQFFQLAVVIAQQLPRELLQSTERTQSLIDSPGEWGPRLRQTFGEPAAPAKKTDQPALPEPREFPIWKTIKVGKFKTLDGLRKTFKKTGCKISEWASSIIGKPAFKLASEETEVDLAKVSGYDLGFTARATRKDIYDRATKSGLFNLELCQAEDGPSLREQYLDQPYGEWLRIAMEPIADSSGGRSVFYVGRVGGRLLLDAHYGYPAFLWFPGDVWVFRRRK